MTKLLQQELSVYLLILQFLRLAQYFVLSIRTLQHTLTPEGVSYPQQMLVLVDQDIFAIRLIFLHQVRRHKLLPLPIQMVLTSPLQLVALECK